MDPRRAAHLARVRAAHTAARTAAAVEQQVIRDVHDTGVPIRAIAMHALGTLSRQRVATIIATPPGIPTHSPTPTPVVYLHSHDTVSLLTWDRIEHAMWARGWMTTHNYLTAWHLSYGGAPTVRVEVANHRGDGPYIYDVTPLTTTPTQKWVTDHDTNALPAYRRVAGINVHTLAQRVATAFDNTPTPNP